MSSFALGKTSGDQVIDAYRFGQSGPDVLIIGGVHGDEVEGVIASKALFSEFDKDFPYHLKLTLIPVFNVDGVLAGNRLNGNGVDLNRNLPTNDWNPEAFNKKYPPGPAPGSEPENKALLELLNENRFSLVISLHSYTKSLLNVNGDCEKQAQLISKKTGLPIEKSMGYPTPGCLGTYCGLERDMPTITYELLRGLPEKEIISTHVPAIMDALQLTETLTEKMSKKV